jgi:hypothetical protein
MTRLWAIAVAITVGSTAMADKTADPAMGVWEGSWTASDGDSGRLSAKIAPLGNDEYRFAMTVDEKAYRLDVKGRPEGNAVKLGGKVDLGSDDGGAVTWSATFADENCTGSYKSEDGSGTLRMRRVHKKSPTLGAQPPRGAIALFDGTDLDRWTTGSGEPPAWKVEDGVLEVAARIEDGKPVHSDIFTKRKFSDQKVHVEFRTPLMPQARGQARGNSGVYLQGRYEVQVLDSFAEPPRDNEAGGIYKIAAPKVNASLPPGEWQTYDITFRAPRFNSDGEKTASARISVRYNGVLIHDDVELPHATPGGLGGDPKKPGSLLLQDHGNPVQYRNIWVLPQDSTE